MKFADLNDKEKKQCIDLITRTLQGELFTEDTFKKMNDNVSQCFIEKMSIFSS